MGSHHRRWGWITAYAVLVVIAGPAIWAVVLTIDELEASQDGQ